jgi:hypothetical protein
MKGVQESSIPVDPWAPTDSQSTASQLWFTLSILYLLTTNVQASACLGLHHVVCSEADDLVFCLR